MSPRRLRRLVAPAVASVVLLALAAPIALADRSLRIVVSNDDGWIGPDGSSTPLIATLRNALAADGHDVTVVAPATDQTGTGTRLTFSSPLALLNPAPRVWTVSGSPGDAVFLADNVLFSGAAPDLIVSGINPGGNYTVAIGSRLAGPAPGSDWEALRAGNISITPIDADGTSNQTPLDARRWSFLTHVLEDTGR